MPIKILIVDDHPLYRKGLRLLFEDEQDMTIVGEAGDGQEAINRVREHAPDVVVMDITMPNLNGVEATRHILAERPDTKIVALSIHDGKTYVQDMLSAGAVGYVLKDSVPDELPNGIRKVLRGEVYLSSAIAGVVVSEYVNLLSGDGKSAKPSDESQTGKMSNGFPVNNTKLYRPPIPGGYVHRQRLIEKLNQSLSHPITIVTAPAGYGKSTLVSQWLANCDFKSSWISLDKNDNDLRQFFSYLVLAVRERFSDSLSASTSLLKLSDFPSSEILVQHLFTDMNAIDQRLVLVLDDYHVIQNEVIHELLEGILRYRPQTMHLVLVSRVDSPLPLATLRAKGQMTEIRMRDLRFSREETTEFLQLMLESTLEERIVSLLEEKSEGWITGLRLAALSLRQSENMALAASGLPDTNRYVLDYFVEEIISQQPTTIQDYLIATSILDRFCAPLCDAVCVSNTAAGANDINGHEFLQLLIKANLFIIHLDDAGMWFRYHHLFQSLLQNRIKQRFTPDDIKAIHTNASTWFAENGYVEEAIQHALAGGEIERATEIVGHARYDLMNRDQWHRLERWLKLFSHEVVQQNPHLILLRCWLDLYHWYRLDYLVKDLDQADTLLGISGLNARETDPLNAEMAAIRGNLSYWLLEPSHGVSLSEQAIRDSPEGHECTRSTAVFGWGPLCQMLGDAKQGERILWDHMEDGRYIYPSSQARFLLSLCIIYWPEAETRKLQQAASRLLQLNPGDESPWDQAFARYFLGLAHYDRNELNEAVAQFETVVEKPYFFQIQHIAHCSFLLSLSYQALGLTHKARKVAESFSKLAFERGNQMFIALSDAFQADLDLRQGRIARADQWARGYTAPAPHGMQRFFNAELTYIRVMMARNTPEGLKSVAEQLDSMHKLLVQIHHRRLLIDVMGMQALLADAMGQESTAFEKLSQALILAEPGVIIRPFLDLGYKMGALLKRLANQSPDLKYTERILEAFRNKVSETDQKLSDEQSSHRLFSQNQTLLDPLTDREMEILLILSKRLSNHEIAERLFISVETVKRHLSNIYQKLDVKTRKQALVKARYMGLL